MSLSINLFTYFYVSVAIDFFIVFNMFLFDMYNKNTNFKTNKTKNKDFIITKNINISQELF